MPEHKEINFINVWFDFRIRIYCVSDSLIVSLGFLMKSLRIASILLLLTSSANTFAQYSEFTMDLGLKFGNNAWGYYYGVHYPNSRFGFLSTGEFSLEPETYGIGGTTTVCNNGGLSGSTGSGSCSWNGGVSHQTDATYDRFSIGLGATYKVIEPVSIVLIGVWSAFTHHITVGNIRNDGDSRYGVETGLLFRLDPRFNVVFLYHTEAERYRFGAGTSIFF